MMEMLSLISFGFFSADCRNPGATCDPISTLPWFCAILTHGSSSSLVFTLAPFLRPPRRELDPEWISFPRSNRTFSKRGERGDLVPTEAVGLLPRASNPSAAACRQRPILPGSLVTVFDWKEALVIGKPREGFRWRT